LVLREVARKRLEEEGMVELFPESDLAFQPEAFLLVRVTRDPDDDQVPRRSDGTPDLTEGSTAEELFRVVPTG
jgi:hypothetical protein